MFFHAKVLTLPSIDLSLEDNNVFDTKSSFPQKRTVNEVI